MCQLQVGTDKYDQEYQAVKYYGNANSTTARNSYQQETPFFWSDDVSKYTRLTNCNCIGCTNAAVSACNSHLCMPLMLSECSCSTQCLKRQNVCFMPCKPCHVLPSSHHLCRLDSIDTPLMPFTILGSQSKYGGTNNLEDLHNGAGVQTLQPSQVTGTTSPHLCFPVM